MPRPWERASRAAAGILPSTAKKGAKSVVKGVVKTVSKRPKNARRHVSAQQPAAAWQQHAKVNVARQPAAARQQHAKVKGTEVKTFKDGRVVRVVHASGREFSPNDIQGVHSHLEKLQRTGKAPVRTTKWAAKQQRHGQAVKGLAAPKKKAFTAPPGRFAASFKAKVQKSVNTSGASGQLKFTLPQVTGTAGGLKFTPAAKVKPAAKVASIYVKKKILKPTAKAGGALMDDRHKARIQEEGRKLVNNTYFTGKVVSSGNSHVWVLPLRPSIPAHLQSALKRTSASSHVYVSLRDVRQSGLQLVAGTSIRFKLYTDSKGVGGCEVISA